MLQAIRRGTKSWITKAFLLLIVASFAVWGVGDILRGPRDSTVITVGDRYVTASEFSRAYQLDMRLLQARLNMVISAEDARRFGVVDATVKRFVDRSLIAQAVDEFSLAVSEAVVQQRAIANPAFQNSQGRFDRRIFEASIRNQGMDEQMYFATSRGDIARELLVESVAGAGAVPKVLARRIYAYRQERRAAQIIVIPHAAMTGVGAPDEGALAAFHQEWGLSFTAPEYRSLAYLSLAPADLVDEISISEDELGEEYQMRLDDYVTLARRDVDQIVLEDEAAARAAHERLTSGADFAEIAAEIADLGPEDISLGMVTETALPAELGKAVFALPENGLSGPLKSPFGWHLFRVKALIEGGTRSLDEVREELTRTLKLERAGNSVFELANELQDALAGGATLEEAARKLDLRLRRVEALDRAGADAAGTPVADLPDPRTFIATAFQVELGIESDLAETDQGSYYILRVDKITAPALRPLESVRDEVADAWRAEQRRVAARAKAEEAADKVRGGAGVAAVAAELGFETRLTPALTRDAGQADPAISGTVLSALFALGLGEVATGPAGTDEAQVVARLESVETPSPEANAQAMKRITEELRLGLAVDVLTQYRAALEKAYKIEINEVAIDTLLGLGPS